MARTRAQRTRSRIVSRRLFATLLGLELAKARRLQYCVSVLSISPDGVDENALERIHRLSAAIIGAVRETDILVVRPPDAFTIMLVDAEISALPIIVDRIRQMGQVVSASGPAVVSWSAGGSCYPKTEAAQDHLLRQAIDLMAMARRDGGNRLYLPT